MVVADISGHRTWLLNNNMVSRLDPRARNGSGLTQAKYGGPICLASERFKIRTWQVPLTAGLIQLDLELTQAKEKDLYFIASQETPFFFWWMWTKKHVAPSHTGYHSIMTLQEAILSWFRSVLFGISIFMVKSCHNLFCSMGGFVLLFFFFCQFLLDIIFIWLMWQELYWGQNLLYIMNMSPSVSLTYSLLLFNTEKIII